MCRWPMKRHLLCLSPNTCSHVSVDSSYNSTNISFTGVNGPTEMVNSVLEILLPPPPKKKGIDIIVTESNHYAASCIHGCSLIPKLRMHNWRDVTRDDLHVIYGL
jgi:hypothetical protein